MPSRQGSGLEDQYYTRLPGHTAASSYIAVVVAVFKGPFVTLLVCARVAVLRELSASLPNKLGEIL